MNQSKLQSSEALSFWRETIHSTQVPSRGHFGSQVCSVLLHVVPHLGEEKPQMLWVTSVFEAQDWGPWHPLPWEDEAHLVARAS